MCLKKEPTKRYASPSVLADDLEGFCEDYPYLLADPPNGLLELLRRSYRTKWWRVKLMGLVLALALVSLSGVSLMLTYQMVCWSDDIIASAEEAKRVKSVLTNAPKERDEAAKRSQRLTMFPVYEALGHTRPSLCPSLPKINTLRDPKSVSMATFLDKGIRALAVDPPDWRVAHESYRQALEVAEAEEKKRDREERRNKELAERFASVGGRKPKQSDLSESLLRTWKGLRQKRR